MDDLAKLMRAVAAENWPAAREAGNRIADAEERIGHHDAAHLLRGSLLPNGHLATTRNPGQAIGDPGLLSAALSHLDRRLNLKEVDLKPTLRVELEGVIAEWRLRDQLLARGVAPRQKLLFHGPPGCGKSITALALGNELGLPTYLVRLEAVVGAYLGQTAVRVRELFRFAEQTPCVLLIDEIDALGKQRGNQMDVGELDRVAISLMQMLEHAIPKGLVVATSNLLSAIDQALLRRFDQVLKFPRPSEADVTRFAARRAAARGIVAAGAAQRVARRAHSYADAERRIVAAERAQLLRMLGQ